MRKLIAAAIAASMTISALPIFASAAGNEIVVNGNTAAVTAEDTAVAIVATYDENGKLVKVTTTGIQAETKNVDVKPGDKVMLWNKLGESGDEPVLNSVIVTEPTEAPTVEPTVEPTEAPTAEPTVEPTEAPTAEPTEAPTAEPTEAPTAEPTEAPTATPTAAPTATPTAAPTATPTAAPTATPTPTPAITQPAAYEIVPDASSVTQGDNITFTFKVKNLADVDSIAVKLSYDTSKLTYVSSTRGGIYSYSYASSSGKVLSNDSRNNAVKAVLGFTGAQNIYEETFFNVTFKAAENAVPGMYNNYISVDEATVFRGADEISMAGSVPSIGITKAQTQYTGDVSFTASANKTTVSAGDRVTYTVALDQDVSAQALQIDIDFSGLDISAANAALGSALSSLEAMYCDTAFNNGVLHVVFANDSPLQIKAGTLATFSFTVASDITSEFTPKVTDSSVKSASGTGAAGVTVSSLSPKN